jgi:hypothetical protein
MRQVATGTTSCERVRKKPGRPSLTAARMVVRKPQGANETCTGVGQGIPARSIERFTISAFNCSCVDMVACCHGQAPQPLKISGHGGATRWGEGSITLTTEPLAHCRRSEDSSIRTRSPGSAPFTKMALPVWSRATPLPSGAMPTVVTSKSVSAARSEFVSTPSLAVLLWRLLSLVVMCESRSQRVGCATCRRFVLRTRSLESRSPQFWTALRRHCAAAHRMARHTVQTVVRSHA